MLIVRNIRRKMLLNNVFNHDVEQPLPKVDVNQTLQYVEQSRCLFFNVTVAWSTDIHLLIKPVGLGLLI